MPIILRSLRRSSCATTTSFISIRRVPVAFSTESRIAQKQSINLSSIASINSSAWTQQPRHSSSDQKAKDLNRKGTDNKMSQFDDAIKAEKEKQARTPWHREGVDQAPASRPQTASAMAKGIIFVYAVAHGLNVGRQASDHPIQTTQTCPTLENA